MKGSRNEQRRSRRRRAGFQLAETMAVVSPAGLSIEAAIRAEPEAFDVERLRVFDVHCWLKDALGTWVQ